MVLHKKYGRLILMVGGHATMDMKQLGRRLAAARERKDWTQQRLATESRVGQNQISRLESGQKPRLEIATLAKLARALGCTADYLLGLADDDAA